MIAPNISELVELDNGFSRLAASLAEKFNCNWDDAVHDSYGLYVRQIMETSEQIHTDRTQTEIILRGAEALHIDTLCAAAEQLCREAENI